MYEPRMTPQSDYMTIFLQLREPLLPVCPLIEKWRELILPTIGDVSVSGSGFVQGKSLRIAAVLRLASGGQQQRRRPDLAVTPTDLWYDAPDGSDSTPVLME